MGWDEDGSGRRVFRCGAKTYCPDLNPYVERLIKEGGYNHATRSKRKMRHYPPGGPAEEAKKKRWMKDRRFKRRMLVPYRKKPLPTNPVKTDTRYHMRKRFEGRPASAEPQRITKTQQAREKMRRLLAKLKTQRKRLTE